MNNEIELKISRATKFAGGIFTLILIALVSATILFANDMIELKYVLGLAGGLIASFIALFSLLFLSETVK